MFNEPQEGRNSCPLLADQIFYRSYVARCVVIFIKILASLLLSRSFGNLIYDIAAKYPGGTIITDLRKLEKASIKARKAELDLNFLRNCQAFNVFPKFLCFQLPNVARQDVISIRKHLLKSAIAKRSKEYRKATPCTG